MSTTPIESFYQKECEKIDALKVNAYTDLYLDPDNPTGVILDTSWGVSKLDLASVVKAGETVTHLYLAPEGNPTVLKYEREDGQVDCITGDELSRIISLTLLKDVTQDDTVENGDVLMYNENTKKFEYFNLQSFVDKTNNAITTINATLTQYGNRLTSLENRMTAVENRVSDIEGLIYNYPADKTTKIPRANINVISDYTNSDNRTWGVFSHDPNNLIPNDEFFA